MIYAKPGIMTLDSKEAETKRGKEMEGRRFFHSFLKTRCTVQLGKDRFDRRNDQERLVLSIEAVKCADASVAEGREYKSGGRFAPARAGFVRAVHFMGEIRKK